MSGFIVSEVAIPFNNISIFVIACIIFILTTGVLWFIYQRWIKNYFFALSKKKKLSSEERHLIKSLAKKTPWV